MEEEDSFLEIERMTDREAQKAPCLLHVFEGGTRLLDVPLSHRLGSVALVKES